VICAYYAMLVVHVGAGVLRTMTRSKNGSRKVRLGNNSNSDKNNSNNKNNVTTTLTTTTTTTRTASSSSNVNSGPGTMPIYSDTI
jgi:hypothetical protein